MEESIRYTRQQIGDEALTDRMYSADTMQFVFPLFHTVFKN